MAPLRSAAARHRPRNHEARGSLMTSSSPAANCSSSQVATRSRGSPRVGNRLLSRVRDFVDISSVEELAQLSVGTQKILQNNGKKQNVVDHALDFLDVDLLGLQPLDRRYLKILIENFDGGPAGIEAIAASLSEDRRTLEELVEPYLLKIGFIVRSPRGRQATGRAYEHLGILQPLRKADDAQTQLV